MASVEKRKGAPLSFFLVVQVTSDRGRFTSFKGQNSGEWPWHPGRGGRGAPPSPSKAGPFSGQNSLRTVASENCHRGQDRSRASCALPCQRQHQPWCPHTWAGLAVKPLTCCELHVSSVSAEFLFQAVCLPRASPFPPIPSRGLFLLKTPFFLRALPFVGGA